MKKPYHCISVHIYLHKKYEYIYRYVHIHMVTLPLHKLNKKLNTKNSLYNNSVKQNILTLHLKHKSWQYIYIQIQYIHRINTIWQMGWESTEVWRSPTNGSTLMNHPSRPRVTWWTTNVGTLPSHPSRPWPKAARWQLMLARYQPRATSAVPQTIHMSSQPIQ